MERISGMVSRGEEARPSLESAERVAGRTGQPEGGPEPALAPDTIVAISTPRGGAARGVIRLSGPAAVEVGGRVLEAGRIATVLPRVRRGIVNANILLGETQVRVPVRLLVQRAPHSFTGEDVVELHLCGAPLVLETVQALLVKAGARLATAGEFTRRAFLSGRLDLTRAEAVLALIRATDEQERREALSLLRGGLETRVAVMRDRLLEVLVPLELELDFSDQDLEILLPHQAGRLLRMVEEELAALATQGPTAAARRQVYRVVLAGPTNAGKSSLFNRLLGREAALVACTPGTTRDVLTGELAVDGMTLQLVDTAGEGFCQGEADHQAHRQRMRRLQEADLVLQVRDAREGCWDRVAALPPCLLVGTRLDLLESRSCQPEEVFLVSNSSGEGIEELRAAMVCRLRNPGGIASSGPVLVNARHATAFAEARSLVQEGREGLEQGRGRELVAADLRAGLAALAAVTGEEATGALLDRIFADFCIGK